MPKVIPSNLWLHSQPSQSPSTHTSLFRRFQSKDASEVQAAWEDFYERYCGLIEHWADRLQHHQAKTSHLVSTDDLVMKVVMAIGQRLRGDFRYDSTRGQFRGYLYRVIRNIRVNIIREQLRTQRNRPDDVVLESIEDQHQAESIDGMLVDELFQLFREALWHEIRAVRGRWRSGHRHMKRTYQAWWLCRVKEEPWDRIAVRLQVSEATAKKQAQRFHGRLISRLKPMASP